MTKKSGLFYVVAMAFLFGWSVYITADTAPLPGDGDPAYYAYASRSLRAGEGLRNLPDAPEATERLIGPNGGVFSTWPPAYPVMLALFDDPLQGAAIINAASLTLAIVATWVLAGLHLRSPVLRVAVTASLLLSTPAAVVFHVPMTEAPFLACVLLWVIAAQNTRQGFALMALSLCTVALVMLRYMGVIFIPLGLIVVMSHQPELKPMVRRGVTFLALPVVACCWWFLRNYAAYGRFTGHSQPGVYGYEDAVYFAARTIFGWIVQVGFIFGLIFIVMRLARWFYFRWSSMRLSRS